MQYLLGSLGSLKIAVPLLVAIAGVLAWGTIYEARFGTSAVQRFVYHSWWFQLLLGFLGVNLAVAALGRYPWKRRHLPFVLAHLGIILILLGGIIGGRFGIEGQLIIPEGRAEQILELPGNVLLVHQPNPGVHHVIPTRFESQAWVHEPNLTWPVVLGDRTIQVTADRYAPDAVTEEEITEDGTEANPAVRVQLMHEEQRDELWLFARDPERFGAGWGEAHVLFLEPAGESQLKQLLGQAKGEAAPRGTISVKLPGMKRAREIPVPADATRTVAVEGTPYTVMFKDYFADFAITEEGPVSRSAQPNNPAVSFVLTGPEGTDVYLLFALHPEFQAMHGFSHKISGEVGYAHAPAASLPPNGIGLIRAPSGALMAVLTGAGDQRQIIDPVEIGASYAHSWLGYQFSVAAYYPTARLTPRITNRSNEVRAEAVHLTVRDGEQTAETWLSLRGRAELPLGAEPVTVEYRPAQRELPVTIKLLDFRKIDYPGTQMAAGFESDVELTDSKRGLILMRKISMNKPLRYRGFSFFQSSYIDGPTQTTVLSVRSDPGTPLVYAGFLIVIAGVVSLFLRLGSPVAVKARPSARRKRTRSRST